MATTDLRRKASTIGWYLALTTLSVLVLFPVYMTLVRALSNPREYLLEGLPLYPVATDWGVFGDAWDLGDMGGRMLLSFVVTIVIVAAQLVTSLLAAYAFAFLRFPLKRLTFAIFMATLLLPLEVTLLPNVQTMRELGWFDSYQGLISPFAAAASTGTLRPAWLAACRSRAVGTASNWRLRTSTPSSRRSPTTRACTAWRTPA